MHPLHLFYASLRYYIDNLHMEVIDINKKVNRDMVKGFIDPIVLSVIARKDSYGYEIAKFVNEQTEGALELKEGTLYPALRRLESHGLIEGYWGNDEGGPRRRYYLITEQGLSKLEDERRLWQDHHKILSKFLGEAFAQ